MSKLNLSDALGQLRRRLDNPSGFMRVHKIRSQERRTPSWAVSDEAVRKILLTAFPRLHENATQRKRAARWNRIIILYFRKHLSYSQVAEEIGEKKEITHATIRSIYRVASGRRSNSGKPLTRNLKKGSPSHA